MAVREIVLYPGRADVLREKSEPVGSVTGRITRLLRDLKDTLHAHPEGIGLAAPQIGVHNRVVVVRLGGGRDSEGEPGPPLPLVNPEVIETRNEEKDFDGCLSFHGLYAETVRPHYLRAIGLDEAGNPFDRIFEGFDAVVARTGPGLLEPLFAVYRKSAIAPMAGVLAAGRNKISDVFEKCRVKYVDMKDRRWYKNINTPEEYRSL